MNTVAVIGHGRSPEGRCWGTRIDAADVVVRMWDCHWQNPEDYGTKYDCGFLEATPSMMPTFYQHVKRKPALSWVASALHRAERCKLPKGTELIDQTRWNDIGKEMGGLGDTGRLQFTRGTIAACWAIEWMKPGDALVLVGFDHVYIGETLPLDEAFSPVYQANPGTFHFKGHRAGVSKYGNHDFAIERPVIERLAEVHGVSLGFSQDIW